MIIPKEEVYQLKSFSVTATIHTFFRLIQGSSFCTFPIVIYILFYIIK